MAEKIDNGTFILDQDDNVFSWFLKDYMGSDAEGKIVTMDESMLLSIMNNRNCEVDSIQNTPYAFGTHQNIELYWRSGGRIFASAKIGLHGQSPVAFSGYRFGMIGSGKNFIYFEDVRFHSLKESKNFVYGKNQLIDPDMVHLKYAAQKKLEHVRIKDDDDGLQR